jgi:hypothetical protein
VIKHRKSRLLAAALALLVVSSAAASPPQPELALDIAKKATLGPGGQTVTVTVTATCPEGREVLEAFVYVTQDGNETQFGFFSLTCDSTPHTFVVELDAFDVTFHKGKARASGYLLLTTDESISPTRVIKLKA